MQHSGATNLRVAAPTAVQHLLVASKRERALERHEDRDGNEEPEHDLHQHARLLESRHGGGQM